MEELHEAGTLVDLDQNRVLLDYLTIRRVFSPAVGASPDLMRKRWRKKAHTAATVREVVKIPDDRKVKSHGERSR
jgi:hypothetical protein